MKGNLAECLGVPEQDMEEDNTCVKCKDLDEIVNSLAEKLSTLSTNKEKLKLLTLTPPSWTISKTAEHFNVSTYMVKQARAQESWRNPC